MRRSRNIICCWFLLANHRRPRTLIKIYLQLVWRVPVSVSINEGRWMELVLHYSCSSWRSLLSYLAHLQSNGKSVLLWTSFPSQCAKWPFSNLLLWVKSNIVTCESWSTSLILVVLFFYPFQGGLSIKFYSATWTFTWKLPSNFFSVVVKLLCTRWFKLWRLDEILK